MPTPDAGANDIAGIAARISGLRNAEPEQPTAETSVDESTGETLTSDTDPRIFRTKLGDQEIELRLLTEGIDPETVRLGTLADSDYRQKTMALADERKSVTAKLESLGTALVDTQRVLEVDLTDLEKSTLREDDPEEYLRQLDAIKRRVDRYEQSKSKWQTANEEAQREKQTVEWQKLNTAIPAWLDESIREKDTRTISEQLTTIGYSPEEITSLASNDHRVLLLARKAAMLDAIQSEDIEGKRDKTPPKSARAGAKQTPGKAEVSDLRDQLRKSGSTKDAAAYFRKILN